MGFETPNGNLSYLGPFMPKFQSFRGQNATWRGPRIDRNKLNANSRPNKYGISFRAYYTKLYVNDSKQLFKSLSSFHAQ